MSDPKPSDAAVEAARAAHTACWRQQLSNPEPDLSPMRAALVAAYRVDAPRPMLHREAVWRGIYSAAIQQLNPSGIADLAADAVMELLNGTEG